MRFLCLLLVVIVMLVCCAKAAELSEVEGLSGTTRNDYGEGRTLRTAQDVINPSAEERGVGSTITSFFREAQVQYWIKAGKTRDDVKKALKVEKLAESDFKAHPKYRYYEKFMLAKIGVLAKDEEVLLKTAKDVLGTSKPLNKAEKIQILEWLDDRLPTFEVWKDLRIREIPEAERAHSDALNLYVQFATKYDDQLYRGLEEGTNPLLVIGGNSAQEMYWKTKMWAVRERPKEYVLKLLGIKSISDAKVKSPTEYAYYKQYIQWVRTLSTPGKVQRV